MAIIQEAFFIPDDIETGLATGLYRRMGGIVRYAIGPNKGQIVKHLQPIDQKVAEQAQSFWTPVLRFVERHKKTIIIATAAGSVFFLWSKIKDHEPKVITDFRVALNVYIEAIRKGNMDSDKIENLMIALEELKNSKYFEKFNAQLTADELDVLVKHIYKYTIRLAQNNNISLTANDLHTQNEKNTCNITILQDYLMIQKRILEERT